MIDNPTTTGEQIADKWFSHGQPSNIILAGEINDALAAEREQIDDWRNRLKDVCTDNDQLREQLAERIAQLKYEREQKDQLREKLAAAVEVLRSTQKWIHGWGHAPDMAAEIDAALAKIEGK